VLQTDVHNKQLIAVASEAFDTGSPSLLSRPSIFWVAVAFFTMSMKHSLKLNSATVSTVFAIVTDLDKTIEKKETRL
jgi:hypothetical protein